MVKSIEVGGFYKREQDNETCYYHVWSGNHEWCQVTSVYLSPKTFYIDSHSTLHKYNSCNRMYKISKEEYSKAFGKALLGGYNLFESYKLKE